MITIESSDDEDELHAALALSLKQHPNKNDNNNDANNNNNDSSDDEVEFIGTNNTTAAASSKQTNNASSNHTKNHNSNKNHNDKIATLMSMGFNKDQCIHALQSSNGNLEHAISYIVDSGGSSAVNDNQSSLADNSVASNKLSNSSSNDDKTAVEQKTAALDNKQSATSTSNSNNKMSLADIRAEKHKRYLLSQQNNASTTNHPQHQNGTSSTMLNSSNSMQVGRSINGMGSSSASASSNVSLEGQVQVINNNLIDTNKHTHNDGGWIWVRNPNAVNSRVDSQDNVDRLQAEFSSTLAGKDCVLLCCVYDMHFYFTKKLNPLSTFGYA